MVRRKPVALVLLLLSLILVLPGFLVSYYLFIASLLAALVLLKIPSIASKCPRCKKDNLLEPWVTRYRCIKCNTWLSKEKNGWSRIL
ncbi:hypothetical protein [Ammoniphilus sp. 3BR4]|uniref:hypothetical protein n=1 Tax=Ammoniphilus sp. 3BR4 TaxID=3158265 RepID=UPI00346783C4